MRASSNKTCPLSAQWRDLENTAAATQLNPTPQAQVTKSPIVPKCCSGKW